MLSASEPPTDGQPQSVDSPMLVGQRPTESSVPADAALRAHITADDLITDRALDESDPDRLRHAPIARELAELAIRVETPANIALFGAWGSGKSSILASMARTILEIEPQTRTVRYDAWKYGGSALQRNFIFNAATQLGLPDDAGHREYYRGLYEQSRTADFQFTQLLKSSWASIAKLVGLVLLLLTLLWTIAAAVAIFSGHSSLLGQLTFQAVLALPWALLAPVAAGILQALIQGARVEFEQTAPSSDEQFSRTFRKLIKEALPSRLLGGKRGRLVFLIDELDRCAPRDVAATLAALKTFLDEKDCVFVVAIDREALERALHELSQAAPVDEENPYYSSASSFIDKVFQHQISLPPLRPGRLTRLAQELVRDRRGIWGELLAAEDGPQRSQLMLYALIPSHVRSPRRLKILLNNFATSARMQEARGIDWLSRAAELAKLVALRTEFPVFATDLFEEPRLPSLLVNPGTAVSLSDRSRELLARYAAAEPRRADARSAALVPIPPEPSQAKPVALDPPISKAEKPALEVMARIQNQQLGRYLQRTAQIKDPGRDLLYVEYASTLADIQDSALGQLIEDYAADAPDVVLRETANQPPDERLKALLLVLDMADREVGLERANTVQVLLGISDQVGDAIEGQAERVAETVNSFLLEQQLPDASLIAGLRLACRAPTAGKSLERSIIGDPRLLSTRTSLFEAAALIGSLDPHSAEAVHDALVEDVKTNPMIAVEAFPHLNREVAAALLRDVTKPIQTTLATTEASGGVAKAGEFLDALWDSLDKVLGTDAELLADFSWILLATTSPSAYTSVRSHASYVSDLPEPRKSRHALLAMSKGPEPDRSFWTQLVSESPVIGLQDEFVLGAIKAIFTSSTWSDSTAAAASEAAVARASAAAQPADGDKLAQDVSSSVQPFVNARLWWMNEAERLGQTAVHRALRSLRRCPALAQTSDSIALGPLVRSLPPTTPITSDTYAGLGEMGGLLSLAARRELVTRIESSLSQTAPPSPGVSPYSPPAAEPLSTIARLIAAGSEGTSPADWGIATTEVCAAARSGSEGGSRIVATWLTLNPPRPDVEQLASSWVGRAVSPLRAALRDWMIHIGQAERTAFASELGKATSTPEGWIRLAAEVGLDEQVVAKSLQIGLRGAKQVEQRQRMVDHLLELHPTTRAAQRLVGECVLELLSSGKRNDFDLASRLGPAMGDGHRLGTQLTDALNSAIASHGWKIAEAHRRELEAAGVRIRRKRGLRDRIFGRKDDPGETSTLEAPEAPENGGTSSDPPE